VEAVLALLADQGSVTRERLFQRFSHVSAEDVGAVLNELVCQGIVYTTGRGTSTVYELSSPFSSSSSSASSW
jgi:hypothetical protein